jgi:PKD repeat protein
MRPNLALCVLLAGCGSDRLTAVREPTSTTRGNDAPVAVIDASANAVSAGATVAFDGGRSTDDVAVLRYSWNFGDGTGAEGRQVTHLFPVGGSFTVTLVVFDDAGLEGQATATIDVTAAAATLPSPSTWSWNLVDGSRRGECGGFQSAALTITINGAQASLSEAGGLFGSTLYVGSYDATTRAFSATHTTSLGLNESIRATFDEAFVQFDGEYVIRDPYICTNDVARAVRGTRTAPVP